MVTAKSTTKKTKEKKVVAKAEPVLVEESITIAEDTDTTNALPPKPQPQGPEKYFEAVGRRKEATARVRVLTKKSTDAQVSEDKAIITVNGKPYYEYFKTIPLQNIVESPLKKLKSINRFKATVVSSGGGIHGQADAIKVGLSRALVLFDANFAKKLRKAGFLTRDSRAKERRKYGLKK